MGWRVTASRRSTTAPVTKKQLRFGGGEARLMGGIDYRASRVFGFGLWAALFGGTYKDIEDKDGNVVRDGRATHGWFTLGVRGVLFP